jgi:hypothetical protein
MELILTIGYKGAFSKFIKATGQHELMKKRCFINYWIKHLTKHFLLFDLYVVLGLVCDGFTTFYRKVLKKFK